MPALLFAGLSYLLFNAASVSLMLFLGNLWLPLGVDRSIWPPLPWQAAAAIDLGLIIMFGLQHSVMARAGWKQRLQNIVPAHLDRCLYVIVSSIALTLLVVLWQPIPVLLWRADSEFVIAALWTLYAAGWLLVVTATYMIDHCELFGLKQVWRHVRNLPEPSGGFRTPYLYRYVRHPLYLGWLLVFWSTPQMSAGHLLFAIGMSVYILIGIAYEERDLIRLFGERYRNYRKRVPALIPGLKLH